MAWAGKNARSRAVGNLAEVVLMPTSDVCWASSREMPPGTQVYGGAGRGQTNGTSLCQVVGNREVSVSVIMVR